MTELCKCTHVQRLTNQIDIASTNSADKTVADGIIDKMTWGTCAATARRSKTELPFYTAAVCETTVVEMLLSLETTSWGHTAVHWKQWRIIKLEVFYRSYPKNLVMLFLPICVLWLYFSIQSLVRIKWSFNRRFPDSRLHHPVPPHVSLEDIREFFLHK